MKRRKQRDGILTALKMGSGLVSACAAVLALVLIVYSGYVLFDSMAVGISAFSSNSDLLKYKPGVLDAPLAEAPSMETVNKDYRAWITVEDTPIDYPVVQGKDDLYYAAHDVYGKVSLTGAIYQAAACRPDFSDSYNLLYGHHMDNGAMFGSLDKYREQDWLKSHQTAVLTAKNGTVYDVTFFAAAVTDAYEKGIYTMGNRAQQVIDFLTGDRSRDAGIGTNVVAWDAEAAKDADKVLALSTCADTNTNGRLVVFGRMTECRTEKDTLKLTVKYYGANGEELFPDQTFAKQKGSGYYVVSPQYPGYEADIEIVRGTLTEDTVVRVRYRPMKWTMRIRYLYPDGTEAAEAYEREVLTGENFEAESPVIAGWRPVRLKVSGVNSGRNENYTVLYVPEDTAGVVDMDDLRTPADLGDVYIQAGICAE